MEITERIINKDNTISWIKHEWNTIEDVVNSGRINYIQDEYVEHLVRISSSVKEFIENVGGHFYLQLPNGVNN